MMIALCEEPVPARASAARISGRVSPPSASPPIFRKSRRVTPSQNHRFSPRIVSIVKPRQELPQRALAASLPADLPCFDNAATPGVTPRIGVRVPSGFSGGGGGRNLHRAAQAFPRVTTPWFPHLYQLSKPAISRRARPPS